MNTLVLGYYYRNNYGDDLFEYILRKYIPSISALVNIEDLDKHYKKEYSTVILGCGDIVNSHFLSEHSLTMLKDMSDRGIPLIFLGIGIQYIDFIENLDIGDIFFVRNKTDYKTLVNRYTNEYVRYMPDIVHLMSDEVSISNPVNAVKKVGVSLPFTWISGELDNRIRGMIEKMGCIIELLSINGYEVNLIPFDTSNDSSNSDLILSDILQQCCKVPIIVRDNTDSIKDMDLMICGRFHSVIMSILYVTPFISLFASEKIGKLSIELPLELSKVFMRLPINIKGQPINIDISEFSKKLEYVESNSNTLYQSILNARYKYEVSIKNCIDDINTIIEEAPKRRRPPTFEFRGNKQLLVKKTIDNVVKALNVRNSNLETSKLLKSGVLTSQDKSESFKKKVVQEILYTITGDPYGVYYYGLFENLFKYPLISQLSWIVNDYYLNYRPVPENIINKSFHGVHRSGWQYVLDNLPKTDVVIDTYIDKTFHWNSDFYKVKGIIPYKSTWIGFIHHTFSDYNNTYNCKELVSNATFIESLHTCKGLIVMTEYLKSELMEYITDVPIYIVTHPTELPVVTFNHNRFKYNKNKQLINIGTWLRDVFSIYALQLPDDCYITKSILKNKNCDSYFIPEDFLSNFETSCVVYPEDICRSSFQNMHIKGIYNYIRKCEESVKVIEFLDNDEYDSLLSDNIVFLHYMDASATNTVVECIMRNTPMIVNKIPAIVEMLGEEYPLYYTTMYQVTRMLEIENMYLVKDAYEYLMSMDKTRFTITQFTQDIASILEVVTK
jgi:hypothetical protein